MWVPGTGVRAERLARLLRDFDAEDQAEPAPIALEQDDALMGLLEDVQALAHLQDLVACLLHCPLGRRLVPFSISLHLAL